MWRVWHKLFGWDYVSLRYGSSDIIRKVQTNPDGVKYVRAYNETITENARWFKLT